ncbi:N-6 DNA methylase [Halarcobacter sp.]|uniref:HsdM family class I SAM-dependent methyltransferase n=1 Tax=Halarcobacter sp. TaxID=2321133 RepID=UPI002AAAE626|nr:N-6 DNA methylase [Halarcobacter sp.]
MNLEKYETYKNDFYSNTTIEKRRVFGQYFTPIEIVKFMCQYIDTEENINVLEPAFGLGIFSNYLLNNYNNISNIKAYEIDTTLESYNSKLYEIFNSKIKIEYEDYLYADWQKKFDFVIANPPYFKHIHMKNKDYIRKIFEKETNFKFSSSTNIYCWFLIKSISQLSNKGKLCFIIPSDFLNANYGIKIKEFLLKNNILERIIRFDFKTELFDDAITTSCILFINKNKIEKKVDFTTILNINDINKKYSELDSIEYNIDALDCKKKWRNYFDKPKNLLYQNLTQFNNIGKVKRGIATGDNDFFIFTKSKAKELNIGNECLIPCICKASYMKDIKVLNDNIINTFIKENEEMFLFNGLKASSTAELNYIKQAEEKEINKKYLLSKRKPWFKLENKASADFLVSVLNRTKLNFILNNTNIINLTCYHGLYLNENLKIYKDLLFLYLNSNTAYELFTLEKREYGSGLIKFEPNDINNSYILNFECISSVDKKLLIQYALEFEETNDFNIVEKADELFREYIFPK